jgi:hypothetical protein
MNSKKLLITMLLLLIGLCSLMANQKTFTTKGGKVVTGRPLHQVNVWFHSWVSEDQIETYVEKVSIYGLKFRGI